MSLRNVLDMLRKFPVFLLCFAVVACSEGQSPVISAPIGEPLPDLTVAELARFEQGAAHFRRIFTPEEGLGPRFNENACNACHTDPADGGTGEQLVVKASRVDGVGTCDILEEEGGPNLRRRVTPTAEEIGAVAVPIPSASTHGGRFTTPFLFGLGMVEAISWPTIEALADPDDLNADGISGRIGTNAEGVRARFGRKANTATLADFTDEAFRMEMGLTTPLHPDDSEAGDLPRTGLDTGGFTTPEVDASTFAATVDFVRFLAPPTRAPPDDAESMLAGEQLFHTLGCVGCHVPIMTTDANPVAALSERSIALYSDLLLHDMGEELAGPCTSGATPEEYRTEPLMGLRYRMSFLHDGRAGRVRDAILMHGGEAAVARQSFAALDRVTQERLLDFLGTL